MYKVWKFDEGETFGRGSHRQTGAGWHKIQFEDDDYIPEIIAKFRRTHNSNTKDFMGNYFMGNFISQLIYREISLVPLDQACVYFLELSQKCIIKVGKSSVKQLHDRIAKAQTYSIDEVVCLGIQLCESESIARSLEKTILDYFGRAHKTRGRELIEYDPALELYIYEYCSAPQKFINIGKEVSRQMRQEPQK